MPVKQTVAANIAVDYATSAISAGAGPDTTPPSIWTLQRLPHNPGGFGMGSMYGAYTLHPSLIKAIRTPTRMRTCSLPFRL